MLGRELPRFGVGGVAQAVGRGLVFHRRGVQRVRRAVGIAGELGERVEVLGDVGRGAVVVEVGHARAARGRAAPGDVEAEGLLLVGGHIGQVPLVRLQGAGSGGLQGGEHLPGQFLDFGLRVGMPAHAEEIVEGGGRHEHGDGREPFQRAVGPLLVQAQLGELGDAFDAGVGHAVPDGLGLGALLVGQLAAGLHAGDVGAPPEGILALQRAQPLRRHGARAAGVAREQAVRHEFRVDPARIFQRQRREPDALRRDAVGDDLGGDAHGGWL